MRVLVTGATGFVGRHVIPQLLQRGHIVTAVARDEAKARQFDWFDGIRFAACDIHRPVGNRLELFAAQDAIMHLAWPGLPNYGSAFHLEENLPGSYRFLKSLVEAGVGQLLVTGTCGEYGLQDGPLSEDVPPAPITQYGLAKDTLHKYLQELQQEHSYVLQWARLFYMYGPGQHPNSLLSQLDSALARGDPIFNMSGGEQLRDYLPIEDVAFRLVSLLEHAACAGTVNICSGEPISVRRLVAQHLAERGRVIPLNAGYYPYNEYEPMAFWGEGSKYSRYCNNAETVIFRQRGLPVFQNKVYQSVEAAKLAPVGDVELVQHSDSGLVYNRAFDPALLTYDPDYQNEQACSAAFRQHLDQVLDTLLRNVKLEDVGIEIGCGKGYFLEMLCSAGANVYGYDPTYEGTNPRITKKYFGDGRMDARPDYIVLRHVLEHIPEPWRFLEQLRAQCKATTKIYIEVPCFDWIVANNAVYDIFYEHVNYFTLDALRNAFNTSIEAGRFFGGQYLYFLADLSAFKSPRQFDGRRFEKLDLDKYLRPLLEKRIHKTRDLFVWGAGAKGVTFSNLLNRMGIPIRAIIDINPAKQERFCGGSGLPIISPALAVREISNADVFVMNPVYLTEIRALVANVNANLVSVAQ